VTPEASVAASVPVNVVALYQAEAEGWLVEVRVGVLGAVVSTVNVCHADQAPVSVPSEARARHL
jgi:hypothetical protein